MTYIAIMILIFLWVMDAGKNSSVKSNERYKAQSRGSIMYMDNKGKMYSVKTGQQVHSTFAYKECEEEGYMYRAQLLIELKHYKPVDIGPWYKKKMTIEENVRIHSEHMNVKTLNGETFYCSFPL